MTWLLASSPGGQKAWEVESCYADRGLLEPGLSAPMAPGAESFLTSGHSYDFGWQHCAVTESPPQRLQLTLAPAYSG